MTLCVLRMPTKYIYFMHSLMYSNANSQTIQCMCIYNICLNHKFTRNSKVPHHLCCHNAYLQEYNLGGPMAIFTIKLPADALFLSWVWHLCVPLVHLHSSAFLVTSLEICHVLCATMAP